MASGEGVNSRIFTDSRVNNDEVTHNLEEVAPPLSEDRGFHHVGKSMNKNVSGKCV
jgi:hypothetical protein